MRTGQEKKKRTGNPVVWYMLLCFLVMAGVISLMACRFAYGQKKAELLSGLEKQLFSVTEEYKAVTENFWEIYLPIYEERDDVRILSAYFENPGNGELPPMEQTDVAEALSHMAVRNEKVDWIVLFSPKREVNYIYLPSSRKLQVIPEDFPYLERVSNKGKKMEIYPVQREDIAGSWFETIAIAGGAPGNARDGSILVGIDVNRLKQLCRMNDELKTPRFGIFRDGVLLYASDTSADWEELKTQEKAGVRKWAGQYWYAQAMRGTSQAEQIFCAVRWWEMFRCCLKSLTVIGLVTSFMAFLAIALCLLIVKNLDREVALLRAGLDILGQNQLDYRIREDFHQPELAAVADAVNQMAARLKENIDQAHMYELRQKESELQELQAKFNPHFLYNVLGIFRARCYQNNDRETGDLIAQTASIFRGFIGSRTFISIPEELAFGKRYLALFHARYGDSVQIRYDIDTEVLQYGIIRNVFQPLIENYFEHGYDPDSQENYFMIHGRVLDENMLLFTVEDNGLGMDEKALEALNGQLGQLGDIGKESYGLRNLHQRLRLFYGEGCGLRLYSRTPKGLAVEMRILRRKG